MTGVAVHLGARVMARAQADEVLVSSTVRDVLAGSELRFIDRGPHELKGFADQWRLYVVDVESVHDRSDASTTAETPTALASSPSGKDVLRLPRLLMGAPTVDYVGRDVLLDRLRALWAEAMSGTCRAVLLAGEPGVGKTRTASELAQTAFSSGAIVLYGRCDEEAAIPYQPFVEALDWYVDHTTEPVLGRYAGDLDRLDPLLRRHVSRLPPRTASDPRFEEHLLFEATRSWLVELSRRQPLVLVIDDLHWASKPVLLMLMHVLRGAMAESEQTRFLVVGTYRTGELGSTNPTAIMLGDLQRLPDVSRTDITGLSLSEVEVFVARAAGQELDEDGRRLSQLIYAETDGNPFFVGEVLRHLAESEAVRRQDQRWIVPDLTRLSVPDTVKDLIRRRVTALSAAASQALTTAAVVGRDFDLEILEAVTGIPDHQLLDAMEEAVRARLVEETGSGLVSVRSHVGARGVSRGALTGSSDAVPSRHRHRARTRPSHGPGVVGAPLRRGGDGQGRPFASGRVRPHRRRPGARGARSRRRRTRYRAVLVLVESLEPEQERERVEALCGLGEARARPGQQRLPQHAPHRRTMRPRPPRHLPAHRAVLANSRGLPSVIGAINADRVALTESTLDLIDPGPSAEHARLLANLAAEDRVRRRRPASACGVRCSRTHGAVLQRRPPIGVGSQPDRLCRVLTEAGGSARGARRGGNPAVRRSR